MKKDYLDNMGIEQWVLRDTKQGPSVACYGFQLLDKGKLQGVLLAEACNKDQKIHEMLLNICRALKMEAVGEWYSATPDVSGVIEGCRFVIMMGDFSETFDDILLIKTHAPARLLSEPQLKRKAWEDLQQVASFVGSD